MYLFQYSKYENMSVFHDIIDGKNYLQSYTKILGQICTLALLYKRQTRIQLSHLSSLSSHLTYNVEN